VLSEDVRKVLEGVPDGHRAEPLTVQLTGESWMVNGRIDGLGDGLRVVARAGNVRPEALIRAWVEHLLMCAQLEQQPSRASNAALPSTLVIGKLGTDKYGIAYDFAPVSGAMQVVDALVKQLRFARLYPLPFFPQAGHAWAVATLPAWKPPRSRSKAQEKSGQVEAQRAYNMKSGNFRPIGGDAEDDFIALCFRGREPIEENWDEFCQIATTLFDARPLPEKK
jgi:exonuclease V gamma subunit